MPKRPRPLVEFDTSYYRYPTVSPSLWIIDPDEFDFPELERQTHEKHLTEISKWFSSDFHRMVNEIFIESFDDEVCHSLLTKHGIFVERFFHRAIHEQVTRQFAKANIDQQEFQRLLSSASSSIRGYKHEWSLYNTGDAIYCVIDHIFRQTMYRALSEPQIHSQLETWFREFKTPRNCALCGNEFRVIDLPEWVYFGSNGFQSCCFQCPVETPRKGELSKLIPEFVEICGFIPASDASPTNYSFTSRLASSLWAETISAYAKVGGISHVKSKFGSWFKALAETGALPNGVLVMARGVRCLAKDGHTCHSLDEQRIDNWLFVNGIWHEREPIYPFHLELNPLGRRRADWQVKKTFIEYFGLIGDPKYEKKMDEKIALAQLSGIDLISIYPADIENLDQKLGCLLN